MEQYITALLSTTIKRLWICQSLFLYEIENLKRIGQNFYQLANTDEKDSNDSCSERNQVQMSKKLIGSN